MGRYIGVILLVFLSHYFYSQKVNYEVIKDEPFEPKASVNLDIVNIDLNSGTKNIRIDNISMNIGVFGYVKPIENIGVDFRVHKSWLVAGKLGFPNYPGNFELSLGSHMMLTNNVKTKNTRVVLSSKTDRNYSTNTETITSTYITMPAKRMLKLGVRGGIYYKSGPFNFGDYKDDDLTIQLPGTFVTEETKISSFGIYAGLLARKIRNVIIKDKQFGRSFNSGGVDIYFDALIVPVNNFKDLQDGIAEDDVNVTEEVKSYKSVVPIGFRLGYTIYATEKKEFIGKKFGFAGFGELGYKPYQGVFITAGIGVTIVKSSKAFSKEK